MGCELMAFFDVNQTQIDKFINTNEIDIWDKRHLIVNYYKEQHPELKDMSIIYSWNEKCKMHEMYSYYGVNFIRDDGRLSNRRYHKILEEKHGRPFPFCLQNIIWYTNTAEQAIKIADELTVFFGDDERLMWFADWLRITSKYCSTYELSY